MAGSGTGNASKANEATKPVDNNNNVNKNMQNINNKYMYVFFLMLV